MRNRYNAPWGINSVKTNKEKVEFISIASDGHGHVNIYKNGAKQTTNSSSPFNKLTTGREIKKAIEKVFPGVHVRDVITRHSTENGLPEVEVEGYVASHLDLHDLGEQIDEFLQDRLPAGVHISLELIPH